VGLVLGAAIVIAFAALASGLSDPEIPDGSVAIVEDVEDGEISEEDFEAGLQQVAASQGLRGGVPKEDDPQYQQFVDAAMSDLILERWIRGEAADLGLSVSDREVEQRLEQIQQQNFGSQQEFEKFLDESGFSEEDALGRVELTLLSERIQEEVVKGSEVVPEEDIEIVYEQQLTQFTQPESRSVLTIVNEDKEKVEQAKAELEKDDSEQNWERVADEFSTDPSAKEGGLLPEVREGEGDPAFDEAVFSAEEGELVGPFKTQTGFQLIQVTGTKAEEVQPLDDEVRKTIEDQLASAQQQAALDAFETGLESKWRDRTFCADSLLPDDPEAAAQSTLATRCANFESPQADSCAIDDPKERESAAPEQLSQGCPPPVVSRNPASPQELTEDEQSERQTAQLQPLQQPYLLVPGSFPQGLPQRALPPPAPEPLAGALPPGSVPIGSPEAVPPGAAPPTGAPPTGAPPAGAPPAGAAPPTGGAPPAAP
jgi:peptidyl-prolyl cis-trans isomerase C